ncbi:MAG TPA: ThuA domain-containing protein [Sphingobacteriaceae bacterium]
MKFNPRMILIRVWSAVTFVTLMISGCSGEERTSGSATDASADRVLVFSATRGYRHASISAGQKALRELGTANGFRTDESEDPAVFAPGNLKKYKAIVFLNTTGSFFNTAQKQAFQEFIAAGGGFVGIHAAADSFYDWPWYGALAGGYFKSHPEIQTATLLVAAKDHPATRHLPSPWKRRDEWYNFKALNPQVRVLLTIDEKSYSGGENGDHHPVSWFHEYEGGRAFYTALGHTRESYSDPLFLEHLLGGLKWAMKRDSASSLRR